GGVKYGLEVCMDHAQGVMGTTLGSQGKAHVHLIISSYVGFKSHNAPVTLHSSTESGDLKATTDTGDYGRIDQVTGKVEKIINPGTKQIRFESGGGARLAAGFKANPVKMGPVTIWVIDLDNQKLGISDVNNYTIKDTALQAVKSDYTD